MKKIALLALLLTIAGATFAAPKNREKIYYTADIDCQSCVNKIEKKLTYHKGVTDLVISLPTKTVLVEIRSDKTSVNEITHALTEIEIDPQQIDKNQYDATQTKKK